MAGVDLRSVQELGGYADLALVQRYAHLSPDHLRAAVESLVRPEAPREKKPGRSELGLNLDVKLVSRNGRDGVM
jgi:hypothetical protein